ncbi:MAG: YfhO family protein [Oscillospiraceae bacterium]
MGKKFRIEKKHLCRLGILLGLYALIVILLMRFKYAYGSELDWNGQHYAIPDYFRKLFYETGELFPSFAPNIGGGENIYYLSYYGLYSPIILFSYFLPFVKMSTYIQAVSIIGIAVDIVLFYIFINRKFNPNTSFILSFLFMFSNCLIFHSHRHIMFVNYMPFLLLGLMAVEDYFTKGRNMRIAVYSFLIILCSYYFSIPALLAMTVYGVYCYIKTNGKIVLRDFISCGAGFALRIIIGIMMAGVLLLPTLAVMLGGRDGTNSSVKLSQLLPKVSLNFITGDHYSLGLSCFLITACIIGIMSKDKARRFLCIVMALLISCPVFVFALNAGMYIDAKVLIPFMPLGVVIIGDAYKDLISGDFRFRPVLIATVIALLWGIVAFEGKSNVKICAYIDSAVLTVCLICFWKFRKKVFLKIAMLGVTCISMLVSNFSDSMPELAEVNNNNSENINSLAEYVAGDEDPVRTSNMINRSKTVNIIYNTGFYSSSIYSSLHNEDYNNFYFNEIKNENEFRNSALTTESENLLFKALMGEKYIISDVDNVPTGYEKIKTSGNISLYKNDNVLPVGYVCSDTMSEEEYKKLDYPQNIEALIKYVIILEDTESDFVSEIQDTGHLKLENGNYITEYGEEYSVKAEESFKCTVQLNKPLTKNQVLLLRFDVDNSEKRIKNDARISVNGIQNTLTSPGWKYFNNNNSFEYVITTGGKDEIKDIEFEFSDGIYKVGSIESYVMDYPDVNENVDELKIDKDKSHGDVIEGTVNCSDDGWFNLSIPYDKGFAITVDGEKQEYQKTDTAFIGFPVSKGEHVIKIVFTAPLLKQGKIVSTAGLILFIITAIIEVFLRKRKSVRS